MAQANKKLKSNQVHFILQGKRGVGKRMISAILAQYFRVRKVTPHCFDTDLINATFAHVYVHSGLAGGQAMTPPRGA